MLLRTPQRILAAGVSGKARKTNKMYDQEKINDFHNRAEYIIKTRDKDSAINAIISEIDLCEDKYLNEYIGPLNYLRDERVLDWIEKNTPRIKHVSLSWGHLAAVSFFSWNRADKWLTIGRPLSLITLDALIFCTTNGKRLNQSLLMRELNPRLSDSPKPEVVAIRLQNYLLIDNVPRTKTSVDKIINNLFETGL